MKYNSMIRIAAALAVCCPCEWAPCQGTGAFPAPAAHAL